MEIGSLSAGDEHGGEGGIREGLAGGQGGIERESEEGLEGGEGELGADVDLLGAV